MSDTYQPIYDAVRSRLSNGDIGNAIMEAIRIENVGHYADMARQAVEVATYEYTRPSAVFKPRVFIDGSDWCALYGDNLQDGVAGFGDTPHKAMIDFDINWLNQKAPK